MEEYTIDATLTIENLMRLSERRSEQMIVENKCSFNGVQCNYTNFHPIITNMGTCYQFRPTERIRKSGLYSGLSVLLNVERYDRPDFPIGIDNSYSSARDGVRVFFGNPYDLPMVGEDLVEFNLQIQDVH